MADNSIALQVRAPDVMNSFSQGQQQAAGIQQAKRQHAEQILQTIGSVAIGSMGGKMDGQVDPQKFDQGLELLSGLGVDVSKYKGRPELAPIAARASIDAMKQVQMTQNDQELMLTLQKFEQQMEREDRGYNLQREKFEYQKGKDAQGSPESTLGKLKADFNAGLIDKPTYDAAVRKATAETGGIQVDPDGTVTIGGQLGKLTEGQSKDVNYYIRGKAALENVDKYSEALTSVKDNALSKLPLGNFGVSDEYQQGNQAAREFLAAILRKDTGAAITNQEFEIYGPMFLPQPGDGAEVLAQKKTARERAIEAIKTGMGAKGDALDSLPGEAPAGAPSDQSSAPVRKVINGKTYEQVDGEWYEVE